MRAAIHGTAEGRITTVDHLIDIFHLSLSGMKSIFNFFIIVSKNFLYGFHNQSEDGKYLIMGNGTDAFASPPSRKAPLKPPK